MLKLVLLVSKQLSNLALPQVELAQLPELGVGLAQRITIGCQLVLQCRQIDRLSLTCKHLAQVESLYPCEISQSDVLEIGIECIGIKLWQSCRLPRLQVCIRVQAKCPSILLLGVHRLGDVLLLCKTLSIRDPRLLHHEVGHGRWLWGGLLHVLGGGRRWLVSLVLLLSLFGWLLLWL